MGASPSRAAEARPRRRRCHASGDAAPGGGGRRRPDLRRAPRAGADGERLRLELPSVTPVACSEMMTGIGPGGHWVMGMNWFHRVERRYIEYGSSFEATRTFGLFRAMYDLVYNMNLDHLSWEAQTVFERPGDGIRTAATPFLIYRGRTVTNSASRGSSSGRRPPRTSGMRSGDPMSSSMETSTRAGRRAAVHPSPGREPETSTRRVLGRSWSARARTTSCSSACRTTTSTPIATGRRLRSTR